MLVMSVKSTTLSRSCRIYEFATVAYFINKFVHATDSDRPKPLRLDSKWNWLSILSSSLDSSNTGWDWDAWLLFFLTKYMLETLNWNTCSRLWPAPHLAHSLIRQVQANPLCFSTSTHIRRSIKMSGLIPPSMNCAAESLMELTLPVHET